SAGRRGVRDTCDRRRQDLRAHEVDALRVCRSPVIGRGPRGLIGRGSPGPRGFETFLPRTTPTTRTRNGMVLSGRSTSACSAALGDRRSPRPYFALIAY